MHTNLTLDDLIQRGVIRVGFQRHTPPFSYSTEIEFSPVGYSVELANLVVAFLGQRFGCRLRIQPVEVTSSNREKLLTAGEIDMECGSTTITNERRQRCSFSRPIFYTAHRIALKKNALSNPFRITGIEGSTSHNTLLATSNLNITFEFFGQPSIGSAFDAFCNNSNIDGIIADEVILMSLLRDFQKDDVILLDQILGGEYYGFLFRLNDSTLVNAVDQALGELINDEVHFHRKFSPWFNSDLPGVGFNLNLDFSKQLHHIAMLNDENHYIPQVV